MKIPVTFLAVKVVVKDRVKGLQQSAEDYIVKPFEAIEPLAYINVVLRCGFETLPLRIKTSFLVIELGKSLF